MRRINYRPYLFLALFLPLTLFLSSKVRSKIRTPFLSFKPSKPSRNHQSEIDQLRLENTLLKQKLLRLRDKVFSDDRMEKDYNRFSEIKSDAATDDFFERRLNELTVALKLESESLQAKVLLREPHLWSSTIWIDVGEKNNQRLHRNIVAKNSPVVVGKSIVGIVEEVEKNKSRVRLITDAKLSPSVRVLRGDEQKKMLLEHIDLLLRYTSLISFSENDVEEKTNILSRFKTQLLEMTGDQYLAKGELHGCSFPLWRRPSQTLKGIGFNYEYSDEEGFARELSTGKLYGKTDSQPIPILQKGDLLVTTGLDGVFPAGFHVAVVSHVYPLIEGDISYDLDAISTAGNLDELSFVQVLPPLISQ